MRYTILLEWDADAEAYAVTVPALPGCVDFGPTVEIATERAKEAIAAWIGWLAKDGDPIPVEDPPLVVATVEVEAGVPTAAGAA